MNLLPSVVKHLCVAFLALPDLLRRLIMLWALTLHSRLARYSPSADGAIAAYVIWLILGPPLPLVDIQHKIYQAQPASTQRSSSGRINTYSFVALIGSQSGPRSHLERARGPFYILPFKHFVAVLGTVRTLFAPPSPEENFPCPHLPPPLLPYRPYSRIRNKWRSHPSLNAGDSYRGYEIIRTNWDSDPSNSR